MYKSEIKSTSLIKFALKDFLEIKKNAKGQNTVPFVSTFHSLGVRIIKENAKLLGLTKYFTILDEGDTTTFVKETLKELGIDPKQYDPKKIKNIISREKGKFTHLTDYAEREKSVYGEIVTRVWGLYEKKKSKENSLDFDDLLLKATKLLKDPSAPTMIIELSPITTSRFGYKPEDIIDFILSVRNFSVEWIHHGKRHPVTLKKKLPHYSVLGAMHGSNYTFYPR